MPQLIVKHNFGSQSQILNTYDHPYESRILMTLTNSALWYKPVDDDFFKVELREYEYVKTDPQLVKQLYSDLSNISKAIICGLNFSTDVEETGEVNRDKLGEVLRGLNMQAPPESLLLCFGSDNSLDIVLPRGRAITWIEDLQLMGRNGIQWFNTAASRNHWLAANRGVNFEAYRYLLPKRPTLLNVPDNQPPQPSAPVSATTLNPASASMPGSVPEPHNEQDFVPDSPLTMSSGSPFSLTNEIDEENDEVSKIPSLQVDKTSQLNHIPKFKIIASSPEFTGFLTPPPSSPLLRPTPVTPVTTTSSLPPVTPHPSPVMIAVAGAAESHIVGPSRSLKKKKANIDTFREKYITRSSHRSECPCPYCPHKD